MNTKKILFIAILLCTILGAHHTNCFQFFIRTIQGEVLNVEIENRTTIAELKRQLEAQYGFPVAHQRIVIAGRLPNDNQTTEELEFMRLVTVHLVLRIPHNVQPAPQFNIDAQVRFLFHNEQKIGRVIGRNFEQNAIGDIGMYYYTIRFDGGQRGMLERGVLEYELNNAQNNIENNLPADMHDAGPAHQAAHQAQNVAPEHPFQPVMPPAPEPNAQQTPAPGVTKSESSSTPNPAPIPTPSSNFNGLQASMHNMNAILPTVLLTIATAASTKIAHKYVNPKNKTVHRLFNSFLANLRGAALTGLARAAFTHRFFENGTTGWPLMFAHLTIGMISDAVITHSSSDSFTEKNNSNSQSNVSDTMSQQNRTPNHISNHLNQNDKNANTSNNTSPHTITSTGTSTNINTIDSQTWAGICVAAHGVIKAYQCFNS